MRNAKKGDVMDTQLKRGLIEVCVLAALLDGESYGWALIKEISNHVEISESTLYPILKRLEAADLLTVSSKENNGRLRKYYKITEKGVSRINDFMPLLSSWNTPSVLPVPRESNTALSL